MLLNDVIKEVGMTKRAVKYYEEKGLIKVKKDSNGYRSYTDSDVEILKKISVYRKLGIGIKEIEDILKGEDKDILTKIYNQKLQEKSQQDQQLEALKQFIENKDVSKANEMLDYQTAQSAIESLLPGEFGEYLKNHFSPFLKVKITTDEQKQALQNLLNYCDETHINVPFIVKLGFKLAGGAIYKNQTAQEMISYYRDMDDEQYQKLKEAVWKGAKLKSGIMKYHPVYVAQRKLQRELQNKGYNDIFIPNLKALSPLYDEYEKALKSVNDRICRELGLYYDSNYNLVIKK